MGNFLRSIRFRLTIYFVAAMTLVVIAVFGGMYFGIEPRLLASIDETLTDAANRSVARTESGLPGDASRQIRLLTVAPARLLSLDGEILAADANFPIEMPLSAEMAAAARTKARRIETLQLGDVWYRVLTISVVSDDAPAAIIQVAQDIAHERSLLADLQRLLFTTIPAAMTIAGLGGWVLAGSALAPTARVRKTVIGIVDSGDLSRRVSTDLPSDEIGRLAATFDTLLERTEQAMARERQFTADASHELRSPLTVIKGEISVALSRERTAQAYRATLSDLELSVDEMCVMVEDMLTLTRASAKQAPTRIDPIDVGILVSQIKTRMDVIAEAKRIDLLSSQSGTRPAMVYGDRLRIQRALTNLVDNALRYTQEGGRVEIRLSGDDERVHIQVVDTGIGIAADHLDRVFDRFFRADAARDRERGGTGLGLAIAKAIVEGAGGELSVTSTLGKGSTFTVSLPALARGHAVLAARAAGTGEGAAT
ncbi:MAG: HAMP domain-containing histidine kinase [Thermoflexales bacterium]|nr:HAMP domain-containing histidine kinase [Thermoflexales bacterium]